MSFSSTLLIIITLVSVQHLNTFSSLVCLSLTPSLDKYDRRPSKFQLAMPCHAIPLHRLIPLYQLIPVSLAPAPSKSLLLGLETDPNRWVADRRLSAPSAGVERLKERRIQSLSFVGLCSMPLAQSMHWKAAIVFSSLNSRESSGRALRAWQRALPSR